MKLLIVGRTASGKDALQDMLVKNYGWQFVKSMTTRPKRHPDENSHTFLTEEEAAQIPQQDKTAWTVVNGYQYFSTKQQIYESDAYIVDPEGVRVLLTNMPEEWFRIIYMRPGDKELQAELAVKRSENPEKELLVFQARAKAEDEQFSAFEQQIKDNSFCYPNCNTIIEFINTYKETDLESLAIQLELDRRFDRNIQAVISDLMTDGLIRSDDKGQPLVFDKDNHEVPIRIELMAEQLANNPTLLAEIMTHWMHLSTTDIPTFLHINDEMPDSEPTENEGEPDE